MLLWGTQVLPSRKSLPIKKKTVTNPVCSTLPLPSDKTVEPKEGCLFGENKHGACRSKDQNSVLQGPSTGSFLQPGCLQIHPRRGSRCQVYSLRPLEGGDSAQPQRKDLLPSDLVQPIFQSIAFNFKLQLSCPSPQLSA